MKYLMLKVCAIFMLSCLCLSPVFATSLQDAKAQGLVGESNDGYLGYVVKAVSPDIIELVKTVNAQRKAKFASTASNNGIDIAAVAKRFNQRAIEKTLTGNFYQDNTGRWQKK